MAMYVYPSGVETPIKNMYIWEYIEPIFNYSYDFRNKTTTQLTNDGWTNTSWLTTWANWITASSWTAIFNQVSWLWTAMTNATKLKLECVIYEGWSYVSSVAWLTLTTWTDGNTQTWFWTDNTGYGIICGSWTQYTFDSSTVYNSSGERTLTTEFDFVSKTVNIDFPSVYSWVWALSITDATIAVARTNNSVRIPLERDRYIKTISVTVY